MKVPTRPLKRLAGRLDFHLRPGVGNRRGPLNSQAFRRSIFEWIVDRVGLAYIVETGTHRGGTTAYFADRGGVPPPAFRFREPGDTLPEDARPISSVTIDYGQTTVSYDWNGTGWDRSQDGSPTVDTAGVRTSPTTVVIQITQYGVSDAGAPVGVSLSNALRTVWP